MSDRPNILLVTTDHWPGHLFGHRGSPVIQSPTCDQLARNGTVFTRAYSECPVCIPARRTLMTGTTPRTHGDRVYLDREPMPPFPTLAQCFRDAGYQATAVGKLHVYPPRSRIGFDDVILSEEGRVQYGLIDDYDLFLGDQGHPGAQFLHGMNNNNYLARPWHLDEHLHITNWATSQMARTIKRRDPGKPGFWYLSYVHPHPPLAPLHHYLDLYRRLDIDGPAMGAWALNPNHLPHRLRNDPNAAMLNPAMTAEARRAFYALCTHIDHQLRVVIGTLREEGLLQNTIICFTADHGDTLGDHGLWAKRTFYEGSAQVPMLLVDPRGLRVQAGLQSQRLVGLQDVMPTLLDLADLPIPNSVEGLSMVGEATLPQLFGEVGNGHQASRMLHDGRFKLVWYPIGNVSQLFDLDEDPREYEDLSTDPSRADLLASMQAALAAQLHAGDERWVADGHLVGEPDPGSHPHADHSYSGQRGTHWPVPPQHTR